jgi:hypothetical protein
VLLPQAQGGGKHHRQQDAAVSASWQAGKCGRVCLHQQRGARQRRGAAARLRR